MDQDNEFGYVVCNIPKSGYGGGYASWYNVRIVMPVRCVELEVILIEHSALILIECSPLSRLSLFDSLSSLSLSSPAPQIFANPRLIFYGARTRSNQRSLEAVVSSGFDLQFDIPKSGNFIIEVTTKILYMIEEITGRQNWQTCASD